MKNFVFMDVVPGVIGCIDGFHISIVSVYGDNAELYLDVGKFFFPLM